MSQTLELKYNNFKVKSKELTSKLDEYTSILSSIKTKQDYTTRHKELDEKWSIMSQLGHDMKPIIFDVHNTCTKEYDDEDGETDIKTIASIGIEVTEYGKKLCTTMISLIELERKIKAQD